MGEHLWMHLFKGAVTWCTFKYTFFFMFQTSFKFILFCFQTHFLKEWMVEIGKYVQMFCKVYLQYVIVNQTRNVTNT